MIAHPPVVLLDASPNPALALLRTAFGLAFVLALAVVVLRVLARFGVGRGASGKRLEVVERLPLDRDAELVLVRVDGRELLVGTARGAAPRRLDEVPPKLVEGPLAEPPASPNDVV